MTPTLLIRLSRCWEIPERQREQMARTGAIAFAVGSLATALGIFTPHQAEVNEVAYYAVVTMAALTALLLHIGKGCLPSLVLHLVGLVGTASVSLSIVFGGEASGGESYGEQMYYLWIALYAGHYLRRGAAAVQVLAIIAAYAAVVSSYLPLEVALGRWITVAVFVAGAAILVRLLTERVDRLMTELRAASHHDHLTGLPNRRAFDEAFDREAARSRRSGQPLVVLLSDLDGFKEINDQFGHVAGDLVLQGVAIQLQDELREEDMVARLGGDEFGVLLPQSDLAAAEMLTTRIEQRLRHDPNGRAGRVGISVGAAVLGHDGDTLDELLNAADRGLYRVKEGRPRSQRYEPSAPWPQPT